MSVNVVFNWDDNTKKIFDDLRKSFDKIVEDIKPLKDIYNNLQNIILEARSDPDSLINWSLYESKLQSLFWTYPYKISTSELKKVIDKELSEKEFDLFISNHFTYELVDELFHMVLPNLDNYNSMIFEQSYHSFLAGDYALCNVGYISIIEGLTSFFIKDKGCNSRRGLFEPIINDLDNLDNLNADLFLLIMVAHNIDEIFLKHDFNEMDDVNHHKKVNRHYMIHGKKGDNKRESSLMLMNTLYYVIVVIQMYSRYKDSLKYNRQKKVFVMVGDH